VPSLRHGRSSVALDSAIGGFGGGGERQLEQEALQLREDKAKGVYVQGARTITVTTADEALRLVSLGTSRLASAATAMNAVSSRSHAITLLTVEKQSAAAGRDPSMPSPASPVSPVPFINVDLHEAARKRPADPADLAASQPPQLAPQPPQPPRASSRAESVAAIESLVSSFSVRKTTSRLTLVDLAGSEDVSRSGAEGVRLSEAKKVNTSLLALSNVIAALTANSSTAEDRGAASEGTPPRHVPFRNSALTRLLRESLGGNSKTTLLCCISPSTDDLTETMSTLRFGSRAAEMRNRVRVNDSVVSTDAAALARELQLALDETETRLQQAKRLAELRAARALLLARRLLGEQAEAERARVAQRVISDEMLIAEGDAAIRAGALSRAQRHLKTWRRLSPPLFGTGVLVGLALAAAPFGDRLKGTMATAAAHTHALVMNGLRALGLTIGLSTSRFLARAYAFGYASLASSSWRGTGAQHPSSRS
jgi:hypothetical protein